MAQINHPEAQAVAAEVPTVADPAPLGLAGFAMTTFVLSVFNANIITDPTGKLAGTVLPLALFYGGLVQLLAGMWEFKNRNTFGAVAFSSYGGFWLAYAAYAKFVIPGLPKTTANQAVGLFLLAWAIFTIYMILASLRVERGGGRRVHRLGRHLHAARHRQLQPVDQPGPRRRLRRPRHRRHRVVRVVRRGDQRHLEAHHPAGHPAGAGRPPPVDLTTPQLR